MTGASQPQPRWLLPAAVAAVVAAGVPNLLGRGIDVPDDALLYDLPSWRWLATAVQQGQSPWWVPGKLGGVNLFGDVVPMGVFYPAAWSGLLLPPELGLPLFASLHAIGLLLGVRWLARELGASGAAGTLAGAALALGPLGAFAFVDGRHTAWAGTAWLPVALACFERARGSPRWAALGGLALGAGLLGSHVRFGAAVGAFAGLWVLARRFPPRVWAAWLGGGLLGAVGALPTLLELQQADPGGSRLAQLALPAQAPLELVNLGGWLAPRPAVSALDYGLGAVLGVAVLLAWRRRRGLWVVAMTCLFAAASTELPGLRWLAAPWLLLTHPVNDVWTALALLPLAVLGALGVDRWLAGAALPRSAAALLAAPALMLLWPEELGSPRATWSWALGLVHAGVAVGVAWRRPRWLALAALLDLALVALRVHTLAPSPPLPAPRPDPAYAQGTVDVEELLLFEGFAYAAGGPPPEDDRWVDVAASVQGDFLQRRWPTHGAVAFGTRGLSGHAKMAPRRQVLALQPVAAALQAGASTEQVFGSGGLGWALAQWQDVGLALTAGGVLELPVAPRCRVAPSLQVADEGARLQRLRSAPPGAAALAGRSALPPPVFVEQPSVAHWPVGRGRVGACPRDPGEPIEVQSDEAFVLVVSRRFHPGWSYVLEGVGGAVPAAPADHVHTAIRLPAGAHRLRGRFVPPGLRLGALLSALGAVVLLATAASRGPRRPRAGAAPEPG